MDDRFTERLSDYIDGEMPAGERAELEAHLAGCASCRATLAQLRSLIATAGKLQDRPPARDLWPAIARATSSRAPRWRWAAAALLLIFGLAYWQWPETSSLPRYLLLLHMPDRGAPPPPRETVSPVVSEYAIWRSERALQGEKLAYGGWELRGADTGPFVPADELVGGMFVIEARDDEGALAIARTHPHLRFSGCWIELRRIEDT